MTVRGDLGANCRMLESRVYTKRIWGQAKERATDHILITCDSVHKMSRDWSVSGLTQELLT